MQGCVYDTSPRRGVLERETEEDQNRRRMPCQVETCPPGEGILPHRTESRLTLDSTLIYHPGGKWGRLLFFEERVLPTDLLRPDVGTNDTSRRLTDLTGLLVEFFSWLHTCSERSCNQRVHCLLTACSNVHCTSLPGSFLSLILN